MAKNTASPQQSVQVTPPMVEAQPVQAAPVSAQPSAATTPAAPTTTADQKSKSTDNGNSKKNTKLLYGLLIFAVIVIVILGIVIIWIIGSNNAGTQTPPPPPPVEPPPAPPPAADTRNITILNPLSEASVTGKFLADGTASLSVSQLTLKLYDDANVLLGTSTVDLASDTEGDPETTPDTMINWSVQVNTLTSPTSRTGRLIVYPTADGEESTIAQTQAVRFTERTSAGRIRLFSPIADQVSVSGPVTFRGEMKDFFEGTMNVRLMTPAGTEIFRDFITAEGDNYGTFASFNKNIEFDPLPLAAGDHGTWELFEISAADGSETVLLILPVRFVE